MKREILELFCAKNTLVHPAAMEHIESQNEPIAYAQSLCNNLEEDHQVVLTIEDVKHFEDTEAVSERSEVLSEPSPPPTALQPNAMEPEVEQYLEHSPELEPPSEVQQIKVRLPSTFKPEGKEYSGEIRIHKDVTGNSSCEGGIKNFTNYFNDRFKALKKLLRKHHELGGAISIRRAKQRKGGQIKIIAMVNEVRVTKQDHKLLELEDENDRVSALIMKSNPSIKPPIVVDDVIGIIGTQGKNDLIYVEELIFPDVPRNRAMNMAPEPVACAFISDTHVGSNTFMKKAWTKFMDWLNGKVDRDKNLAERLKYLVIPGDAVEGIGVYPDQERELEISDIYAQYEKFAEYLQDVPDYINIIIQPGNHDAVRNAEPQPTFSPEIQSYFSSDIIFAGNPCDFSIHDIRILSYHGRSIDDFVLKIPTLSYNTPIQIMREMLTRRHLAPIYGEKNLIAPESQDYLVIQQVPDIFVTGHVHKADVRQNYKGITLINASAWQTQTSFQKIMNFHPDPAKVAVVDLSTREFKFVNFSG